MALQITTCNASDVSGVAPEISCKLTYLPFLRSGLGGSSPIVFFQPCELRRHESFIFHFYISRNQTMSSLSSIETTYKREFTVPLFLAKPYSNNNSERSSKVFLAAVYQLADN